MLKRKTITVEYVSKLEFNGDPAWGLCYGDYVIAVDRKLKGKKLLEIIIHECLHELWPEDSEDDIAYKGAVLARTLWREGFRKVDNHHKEKMQDEE